MTRSTAIAAFATLVAGVAAVGSWAAQSDANASPVSVIVVSSKAEASRVIGLLNKGADFAALAKELSSDPTAANGGYLGEVNPASLRPEFQAALKSMRAGQISPVVRFQSSYAILKIHTSAPALDGTEAQRDRTRFLSSSSSVNLTADYSGYNTNNVVISRYPKDDTWNRSQQNVCQVLNEVGPAASSALAKSLAAAGPNDRVDLLTSRAAVNAARGEFEAVLTDLESAYKLQLRQSPAKVPFLEEWLGTVRLQRAGNALYDTFVLGARPSVAPSSAQLADLEKAIGHFGKILTSQPDNLEVRWLLNLAYMLEARYPDSVPPGALIPPAAFGREQNSPLFVDIASASGMISHGQAGGVIADDFDGDGLVDVAVSSMDDCVPLKLFHNNGDGTFTNRAAQAGLSNQLGGLNIIQTDYDNNGCIDILVLRGGWEFPRRKSLLRNNCDGTFTDVTQQAGLALPLTATQTAVWVDIDNDGKLDLFVGNENSPAQLFLNKGDGTFVNIAREAGVGRSGFTKAVVAGDYDNDGFMDLYVSNFNGENLLFHNNHDRTFTEVGAQAGVKDPWSSFGAFFFDYDNDGWLDLFVSGYCTSVEESVRGYLGLPRKCESSKLFRNMGNGHFQDVTQQTGLDRAMMPMGLNFGDIDNDGYLEFYLGSGNPSFATAIPNLLFHNEGGRRFTDVTVASGTGILPKGHGVSFADLGNNGKQEMVVVVGGAVRSDAHAMRLFENPGNGNDWVSVHLVGVKSNRAAIGARITVTVTNGGEKPRTICRSVGSGGSFGAGPLTQHIGLGKDAHIDQLEIWWPSTGTRQKFTGVGKNQFLEVQEFAEAPRKLDRRPVHLGSAKAK